MNTMGEGADANSAVNIDDGADAKLRDSIIRSLAAVGAVDETRFYADYFSSLEAERFAFIVIDARCLKNPLLKTLIGNIRILSDLGLYPTLLVGAFNDDTSQVNFLTQRLITELNHAKVRNMRLKMASYELVPAIARTAKNRMVPVLEQTKRRPQEVLQGLIANIKPSKVIFLQPSGGLTQQGVRVPVINVDNPRRQHLDDVSSGQSRFINIATDMCQKSEYDCVYVMASPLNLMAELFTTKGSGTMIRRGAVVTMYDGLEGVDTQRLWQSVSDGFGRTLDPAFARRPILRTFLDQQYSGGAVFTELGGVPYLSKFWVQQAARGEGLARDLWDVILAETDVFYWRSRLDNPFNEWYLKHCEGMQVHGQWRIFWRGLEMKQLPGAILAATHAPIDFLDDKPPALPILGPKQDLKT